MRLAGKNINPVFPAFFIVLFTFLAYLPVFQNGFTNWDDNIYITENSLIRNFSLENIKQWFSESFQGLYQPLVLASLTADYAINGLDPFWFHLTNLLLHIINTLLVFTFIRKLLNSESMGLLVMLLFGLHPLHVESVAWVTERKDVLYSFFFLLSLNLYTRYYLKNKLSHYWLSFVFFILALLSKVSAVTLPLTLLLVDFYFKRDLLCRRVIVEKSPFLLAALGFGILNIAMHHEFGSLANYSNFSEPVRFFLAPTGLMYFLVKTLWPWTLSVYNPLPVEITNAIIIENTIYFILLVSLIILVIKLKQRTITLGALFFIITIGLFMVPPGEPVIASERYSYISSIGLFIIIAFGFQNLTNRFKSRYFRTAIVSLLTLWIVFLGIKTNDYAKVWRNSLTLWDHVIRVRGESFLALLVRGNAYVENRELPAALSDYNRSIELNPNYYKTYDRRGHAYLLMEDYPAAIKDFLKSVQLNHEGFDAHLFLGFAFRQTGEENRALHHLGKARQIDAANPEVYYNLGKTYMALDQIESACENFVKALELGLKKQNRKDAVDILKTLCK